ncbi:AraC family transcriptional regulator [Lachnospiraceae bacterium OttesenSCG-928-D06]|nr:AraC family transcriptional regulator [Lachnospiraceae bacterium OttesenSCG-928-D06]
MQINNGFYNFLYPTGLQNPYLQISCIGIEERNHSSYYFDNSERHIDSLLFQYTLSGHGIFEYEDETYDILPGQAFFIHIPSDCRYYFKEDTSNEPWRFIFIMLQGEHAKQYYETIVSEAGNVLTMTRHNKAIGTLFDLFRQARNGQMLPPYYASELGYRFLCQLAQIFLYSHFSYSSRTQSAIQIMEQDYNSINSIEELANMLHITPSHFAREFRNETGVPPIKYLTNIRLLHASKLLQETSLSINDIALACGFSSGNYFTKLFHKQTDMTPLEFRSTFQ